MWEELELRCKNIMSLIDHVGLKKINKNKEGALKNNINLKISNISETFRGAEFLAQDT